MSKGPKNPTNLWARSDDGRLHRVGSPIRTDDGHIIPTIPLCSSSPNLTTVRPITSEARQPSFLNESPISFDLSTTGNQESFGGKQFTKDPSSPDTTNLPNRVRYQRLLHYTDAFHPQDENDVNDTILRGEYSNSDADSVISSEDMASSSLLPPHFHGLAVEDADEWFRDVENYCNFRKMNNQERIGLIPLLLKDGARYWYEALSDDHRNGYEYLKEAFHAQFKRPDANRWRDSANVWSMIQSPGQSVEAFISSVQGKAKRADMYDEDTSFCIIHGLRNNIRKAVLLHEPRTVADIRKWALIAESSSDEAVAPDVAQMIKRLEEKVDKIHIQPVSHTQRPQSAGSQPQGGYDPRSFSSGQNYGGSSYGGPQNNMGQRRSFTSRGRGRGNFSSWRGSGRGRGLAGWTAPSPPTPGGQAAIGWYDSANPPSFSAAAPQNRPSHPQNGQCYNCGGSHANRQNCPARGITCYNCGKMNHFQSVCRQARHANFH